MTNLLCYLISIFTALCLIKILNITDPIIFATTIFAFLAMCQNISIKLAVIKKGAFVCLAVLYGIVFLLRQCLIFNGSCDGSYTENLIRMPTILDYIVTLPVIFGVFLILCNLGHFLKTCSIEIETANLINRKKNYKLWLTCTIIIVFAWLPQLLAYYPGVIIGDSLSSISQALGKEPLGNHFPIVYTLFIKICLRVGMNIQSINEGVFVYTIVQYLVMAASAGYVILWMYSHKINKNLCCLVLAFYSFCGIFSGYAISMWKDPLFGVAGVLMSLMILDVVLSNGKELESWKFLIRYIFCGLFIIFWRNNGIYIFISASVAICVFYHKKRIKKFIITLFAVAAFFAFITGPVYKAYGIQKDTVVESLAIPIQQVAAVIVSNDKLTPEQEKVLFTILPEEDWHSYTPALVDRIKFHENFNGKYLSENTGDFLKVWAQLLLPNLKTYISSYLMETIGFWLPGLQNGAGYFYSPGVTPNSFGIVRINLLEKITGYSFENILDIFRYFISSGSLVWIMFLSVFFLWLQKEKRKFILVLVPALITWGTLMLATPIAFSFRYIFILAFGLPLYILLPFLVEVPIKNAH